MKTLFTTLAAAILALAVSGTAQAGQHSQHHEPQHTDNHMNQDRDSHCYPYHRDYHYDCLPCCDFPCCEYPCCDFPCCEYPCCDFPCCEYPCCSYSYWDMHHRREHKEESRVLKTSTPHHK